MTKGEATDGAQSAGARAHRAMPRLATFLILLAAPALLLASVFWLRSASTPYWLAGNLDPSYSYLLNSLNVANLHHPYHTDHPGTPVQVFGAVVVRALDPLADEDERARAVFKDPERYASAINDALIIFSALSLFVSGWLAYRATRSIACGVLFQLAPFVSLTTLQGLIGIRPEALVIVFALVASALALLALRDDWAHRATFFAIAFGGLMGFGLAAKLIFLPLVVVPLVILPGKRPRVVFAMTSVVSFLIAILPILTVSHLRKMLVFALSMLTRKGFHGHGERGILNINEFAVNALSIIRAHALFSLMMAVSLVVLVWGWRKLRAGEPTHKTLASIFAAQFIQLLLVAKHPNHHYMIPAFCLSGASMVLLFVIFKRNLKGAALAAFYACLAVALLFVSYKRVDSLRYLRASAVESIAEIRGLRANLDKEFAGRAVVEYWGASSPYFALKFGLQYNGGFYASLAEELYPGRYFYNLWTREFSRFDATLNAEELPAPDGWFIMHGAPFESPVFRSYLPPDFLPEAVALENIHGADKSETFYRASVAGDKR